MNHPHPAFPWLEVTDADFLAIAEQQNSMEPEAFLAWAHADLPRLLRSSDNYLFQREMAPSRLQSRLAEANALIESLQQQRQQLRADLAHIDSLPGMIDAIRENRAAAEPPAPLPVTITDAPPLTTAGKIPSIGQRRGRKQRQAAALGQSS